ncbi:hypothetical protein T11_13403, partial [Trichinella zimbabwensis]
LLSRLLSCLLAIILTANDYIYIYTFLCKILFLHSTDT